jgi:hypothetical protein
VLAVVAPTGCDARGTRALWRSLHSLGVRLGLASECHGEAQAEHGWPLLPERLLIEIEPRDWDAVVFIGGPGAARVAEDQYARELAQRFAAAGLTVAGLGMGRAVLTAAGVAGGLIDADPARLAEALGARLGMSPPLPARASRPWGRPILER